MSLYNMLFGENPLSSIVLGALGVTESDVPRFRDAYFDARASRLVIHTRTGGDNREYYGSEAQCRDNYPEYFTVEEPPSGPWNSDLRAIPGFLFDRDDDFDCTYADWFYSVPDSHKAIFDAIRDILGGAEPKPADRWQAVLDELRSREVTPATERALTVAEALMGKISAAWMTNEAASAAHAAPVAPQPRQHQPQSGSA